MRSSTYILFDGCCEQAMAFYSNIFGGELTITSVGASPMAAAFPKEMHNKIVHARLRSEVIDIPASDWLANYETPNRGNMNCMYIDGGSPEHTKKIFEQLSEHGRITDPFNAQPFGWYGRLIDQFGVIWMFHAEK